jgi:hypothetical protein
VQLVKEIAELNKDARRSKHDVLLNVGDPIRFKRNPILMTRDALLLKSVQVLGETSYVRGKIAKRDVVTFPNVILLAIMR